jgi:hypothetical protein
MISLKKSLYFLYFDAELAVLQVQVVCVWGLTDYCKCPFTYSTASSLCLSSRKPAVVCTQPRWDSTAVRDVQPPPGFASFHFSIWLSSHTSVFSPWHKLYSLCHASTYKCPAPFWGTCPTSVTNATAGVQSILPFCLPRASVSIGAARRQ